MKVRIGLALGPLRPSDDFGAFLDVCEDSGVDSLWLSEVIHGPLPDPVVGMGYVVGRTRKLKVGTGVMILPGRQPALVAKELATLARIAPKRILPAFGLAPARPDERQYFPVEGSRAAAFDDSLREVRRLLTDGTVGFVPEPPLDLWLGGRVPSALQRVGRLADGWLGSFTTPAEAGEGVEIIKAAAADAGRAIDDDHYGVSLAVAFGEVPAYTLEAIRTRRPDVDPSDLVPVGWDGLQRAIDAYTAAGVSKFVVRPAGTPESSWESFAIDFAKHVLPMQN